MYNILEANENDFDIIENIGKKSLPIYYDKNDLIMLKYTNHTILKIVTLNLQIIGYIVIRETIDNIHILSIAVDKTFRKKGIGSQLLNNIKLKSKNITLFVHTINNIALDFYKKNNFKIIDIMFSYYDNFESDKDAYKMAFIK